MILNRSLSLNRKKIRLRIARPPWSVSLDWILDFEHPCSTAESDSDEDESVLVLAFFDFGASSSEDEPDSDADEELLLGEALRFRLFGFGFCTMVFAAGTSFSSSASLSELVVEEVDDPDDDFAFLTARSLCWEAHPASQRHCPYCYWIHCC